MTNFKRITQRPEKLAEYMVMKLYNHTAKLNVMYGLNISLETSKRFKRSEYLACLKWLNEQSESEGDGE